jgi:hypothetical protein
MNLTKSMSNNRCSQFVPNVVQCVGDADRSSAVGGFTDLIDVG